MGVIVLAAAAGTLALPSAAEAAETRVWRPNYFFRGFAVHGSSSVPAFPASHGCVRVTIQAMNRLWPLLRIGMPVSLYR
jgi:lipoprotein-anchoring transpeptidase ErfK/SrfK